MSKKPEKMSLKSMDMAEDRKRKLKELFPEVFDEERIDFEKLKRIIEEGWGSSGEEKYEMTWPGKNDCLRVIQEPSIGTLKPCRKESIDFDSTQNLFIEGDNLEVLKLLQKAYYGKIKMIYIDPPYNTGNEFVYPDKYSESLDIYLKYTGQKNKEGVKFSTNQETDGRFHSRWLSMMYSRLFLARNLLKDDGVIFISIDDNEVYNLRKLCNEIFGETNFVACLTWVKKEKTSGVPPKNKSIPNKEYIVVYKKQKDFCFNGVSGSKDSYKQDKEGNYYRTMPIQATGKQNNYFHIINPKNGNKHYGNWAFSEKSIKEMIKKNLIVFPKEEHQKPTQIVYYNEEKKSPIFHHMGLYDSEKQTKKFKSQFPNINFDFPKPLSLLKFILEQSTTKNATILDFFAGSSTTAHAVMHLNKEDGGNRKYIMVQLPEPCDKNSEAFKERLKTIADISKERIRKAKEKIEEELAKENKQPQLMDENDRKRIGNLDVGFKVFKLDKSNFRVWDGKIDEYVAKQLKLHLDKMISPTSSDEDILYEILLKSGFELTEKIKNKTLANKTVYSIKDDELLICIDRKLSKEVILEMANLKPAHCICLDIGFENNDQLKANALETMRSHGVINFKTI